MWFKYAKQLHLFDSGRPDDDPFQHESKEKQIQVQQERRERIKKWEEEARRLQERGQLSFLDIDEEEIEEAERRKRLEFLTQKILGRPLHHGTMFTEHVLKTGLGTMKVPYFTDAYETYFDDSIYLTDDPYSSEDYASGILIDSDIDPGLKMKEFIEKADELDDSPPFKKTLEELDWEEDYKKIFYRSFASKITPETYQKIKSISKKSGILAVRPSLTEMKPDEDFFASLVTMDQYSFPWPDKETVPKWLIIKANNLGIDPGFLAEYVLIAIEELINIVINLIKEDTDNNLLISKNDLKYEDPIINLSYLFKQWSSYLYEYLEDEMDEYKKRAIDPWTTRYQAAISIGCDKKIARGFMSGQISKLELTGRYISHKILSAIKDDRLLTMAFSILSLIIKGSVAHPAIPVEKFEEHGVKKI